MSLRGFTPKTVSVPRGAWGALTNRRKGTPSRASAMQNMRIRFGTTRTRPGTTAVLASAGQVTSIFNWITPFDQNLVLLQDNRSIKSYDQQAALAPTVVLADVVSARAASFAPLDVWTYFCGFTTTGQGAYQARVFGGVDAFGAPQVDIAFRAPPTLDAWGAVDGGPGYCTLGQHFLGVVYQNRSGYAGVPVTTVLGVPMQFTTTAGLRKIVFAVDLPGQPDAGTSLNGGIQAQLFLVATRADNPAIWYFIPNDAQTGQVGVLPVINSNLPGHFEFTFNLSDEDIANSLAGDTAQANFFLSTVDPLTGLGPFNPNFVLAYGQRMCYGAGTSLYVSDINNPQQIAADRNQIRMQNQREIRMAFQLPGNPALYLTGDHWTGYVTDNSDIPATWAEPVGVSDAQGACFPDHVCSATAGNYVWIVTESGVYYFDGQYTGNQLLYLITGYDEHGDPTGWNRVNWNAAYAIQIRDDVANLKLYVAVPLDGATECNFQFVIDYRMGKTFETVDIGIDLFTPQAYSSIGVVKEAATGRSNLWIGPSQAGDITHFDHATHNDVGQPIWGRWQSGLVRGSEISASMVRVGYLDIWARGNAPLDGNGNSTLGIAVISQDAEFVANPQLQSRMGVSAPLVEAPGITYSAKLDMSHINDFTVEFETNAVDAWLELSSFVAYHKPDLSNR